MVFSESLSSVTVDDTTISKNVNGQLQIKPNLTYPAGNGSALTALNVPLTFFNLAKNINHTTQGTWAEGANASAFGGHYFQNTSSATNDQVDYWFYLPSGTYTIYLHRIRETSGGTFSVLIDGASVATGDTNGAIDWNVVDTFQGIVIGSSGMKIVSIKLTAAKIVTFYGITFVKTA